MSYFVHNQTYAFGIDLSRFNMSANLKQFPNFDHIAAHNPNVTFIAMRTGQSWEEKDPAFPYYFGQATRIGACILPYHVIFPGQPALKQVDHLMRILDRFDLTHARLVLDVELEHNKSKTIITNTLLSCLDLLLQETGRYPIVYSRANFIENHLQIEELPNLDWWLAQYRYPQPFPAYTPEHPCPPHLPRGLSNWLIHQTAEKAPPIGGGSSYMDYDRWNGTEQDVRAYFGYTDKHVDILCPLDGVPCRMAKRTVPALPVEFAAEGK